MIVLVVPKVGTSGFDDHPIFIYENASGEQTYGFLAINGPDGGVKVAFFHTPDQHFVIGRHPHCANVTWRADSPGTDSSSFRSSARSLLIWSLIGPEATPSRCLTRSGCDRMTLAELCANV
nr:hypothetical protein [Mycobacterium haemophilum]